MEAQCEAREGDRQRFAETYQRVHQMPAFRKGYPCGLIREWIRGDRFRSARTDGHMACKESMERLYTLFFHGKKVQSAGKAHFCEPEVVVIFHWKRYNNRKYKEADRRRRGKHSLRMYLR